MKKSFSMKSVFFVLLLICTIIYFGNVKISYKKVQSCKLHTYNSSNILNQRLDFSNIKENQVVYLSDIPYSKAQVGWGNISFDKTQDNAAFTMLINGASTVVKKVFGHMLLLL